MTARLLRIYDLTCPRGWPFASGREWAVAGSIMTIGPFANFFGGGDTHWTPSTTFTPDVHINYKRDMIVIEVKDGKSGNSMGVFRAQEVPQ